MRPGRDPDGVTEIVESGDKALGLSGFGPAIKVVGAKIVVEGAVGEHKALQRFVSQRVVGITSAAIAVAALFF